MTKQERKINNKCLELLDKIYAWAKEHNQCSDLVATSDLIKEVEKLKKNYGYK